MKRNHVFKVLGLALLCLFLVGLVGCGDKENASIEEDETENVITNEDETNNVGSENVGAENEEVFEEELPEETEEPEVEIDINQLADDYLDRFEKANEEHNADYTIEIDEVSESGGLIIYHIGDTDTLEVLYTQQGDMQHLIQRINSDALSGLTHTEVDEELEKRYPLYDILVDTVSPDLSDNDLDEIDKVIKSVNVDYRTNNYKTDEYNYLLTNSKPSFRILKR